MYGTRPCTARIRLATTKKPPPLLLPLGNRAAAAAAAGAFAACTPGLATIRLCAPPQTRYPCCYCNCYCHNCGCRTPPAQLHEATVRRRRLQPPGAGRPTASLHSAPVPAGAVPSCSCSTQQPANWHSMAVTCDNNCLHPAPFDPRPDYGCQPAALPQVQGTKAKPQGERPPGDASRLLIPVPMMRRARGSCYDLCPQPAVRATAGLPQPSPQPPRLPRPDGTLHTEGGPGPPAPKPDSQSA